MTFAFLLNFGDLLVRKWDKCTSDSELICWVVDGNLESFIVCIIDLKPSEAVRKLTFPLYGEQMTTTQRQWQILKETFWQP